MRVLKWVAIGLAGLVVLVVAGVFVVVSTIDPNQYKPQIVEAAKKATGRDLVLKGDIKLAVGLNPSFSIADVTFGNAAWGTRPEMVKVGRFEVQVALMPLLSKQIDVKRLVLADTDILLETNAAGAGNWAFDAAKPAAPAQPANQPAQAAGAPLPLPVVREVELRNARFAFRDGKTRETQEVKLERVLLNADSISSPLKLEIAGAVNVPALAGEQKFTLKGEVGSIERALQTAGAPWPVNLAFGVGDNVLTGKLAGAIQAPSAAQGIAMALTLAIPDLQKLAALAKADSPIAGPLNLEMQVRDPAPQRYQISNLKLAMGLQNAVDLSGEATVVLPQTPTGKPAVQANLRSTTIDLVKLFPAKPAAAPARPATATASGAAPSDGRVIPNEKLPFEALNSANADIKYAADSIVTAGATLRDLNLALVLNNGALTVRPLTFDMDGGKFLVETTANAAQKNFTQKVEMRNLDVGRVLTERKLNDWFKGGLTTFDLNLRGQGDTARALAASLNGDVYLNMGPGELGQAATRVIGDWLAKVAPPLAAVNIGTSVRCGIHKIDFQNGVGTFRAGLLDTGVVSARTSGTLNLGTEQLGLNQVVGPIAVFVRGTFANSSIVPDPAGSAQALLSGGAGAITGLVGGAGSIVGGLIGGSQPQGARAPAAANANACAQALAAATGRPAPAAPAAAPAPAAQPAPAQPAAPGGIQLPGGIRLPFSR
jgi:hypothetical protein